MPQSALTRLGLPSLLPRPSSPWACRECLLSSQADRLLPHRGVPLSAGLGVPHPFHRAWDGSVAPGSNFPQDCLCPGTGTVPGAYLAERLGVKKQLR